MTKNMNELVSDIKLATELLVIALGISKKEYKEILNGKREASDDIITTLTIIKEHGLTGVIQF